MPKRPASPAKITRPEAHRALLRPRLFDAIDAHSNARGLWIQGPPGAGKTVLVSSYLATRKRPSLWLQLDPGDADPAVFFHYLALAVQTAAPRARKPLPVLTPDYLPGLPVFTRRFAEQLSERLPERSLLVLDNYEQTPADAPLHALLPVLMESLTPGLQILVLSREAPPAPLTRLQVHGDLQTMDAALLALTLPETVDLAAAAAFTAPPDALHAQTQGWMAGVVLLMAQGGQVTPMQPTQMLFDYFAGEFFANLPETLQRGLLVSALLPAMTVNQIIALSGQPDIGAVLIDFHTRNYFVTQRAGSDGVYEYHPLFRQFLLTRARQVFADQAWQDLQGRAAALLTQAGQSDAAARLYRDAQDSDGLRQLLLDVAPHWLAQGRHQSLTEYLSVLPDTQFDAYPWLRYWLGMATLPLNLLQGQQHLEQAFNAFKPLHDTLGLYAAWAGIMQAQVFMLRYDQSMHDRYAEFTWLQQHHPDFPSPDIEIQFCAAVTTIAFVRSDQALVQIWVGRAEALADSGATPAVVLAALCQVAVALPYAGQTGRALRLLERLAPLAAAPETPPALRILHLLMCSWAWPIRGDAAQSLAFVAQGQALVEQTGLFGQLPVLIMHGCVPALLTGDRNTLASELPGMAAVAQSHPFTKACYLYFHALYRLQCDDLPQALSEMQQAVALVDTLTLVPYQHFLPTLLGWLHVLQGDDAAAERCFAPRLDPEGGCSDPWTAPVLAMARADQAFRRGREADGIAHLRHALALGRTGDFVVWQLMGPAVIGPLYQRALKLGIETEFVRNVIRRGPLPAPDTFDPDWPWPIRIYTLGRFAVELDGAPLPSHRKAQQKPLELLKALVVQGGRAATEAKLTAWLWPDAEGDAGPHNYRTTLHRLRTLLQSETAVAVDGGRLSLNPAQVWVDCSALEQAVRAGGSLSTEILQQRIALYAGHFLDGESQPWMLVAREHWRSQYLLLVERVGDRLEQEQDWPAAIECYLNALGIEPVAEVFYRRLMHLYAHQDRRADALAVYKRCRQALLSHLGCSPSQGMQALYETLSADDSELDGPSA